jgi:probable HAF family extracellular repeat protein
MNRLALVPMLTFCALSLLTTAPATVKAEYTVVPLPFEVGPPFDVSSTGVVVGYLGVLGGYTWTVEDGVQPLTPDPDQRLLFPANGSGPFLNPSPVRINAFGLVAGQTFDRAAAVWNGTEIVPIGTVGGDSSQAHSLNDAGMVVGSSLLLGASTIVPFVWTSNTGIFPLPGFATGSQVGVATGVNNAGEVVGGCAGGDCGQLTSAFLWSDSGELIVLPKLASGHSAYAMAINTHGVVVGWSEPNAPDGIQSIFRWSASDGLGDLNAPEGQVLLHSLDINDLGDIVATISLAADDFSGLTPFLHRDGTWIDINNLIANTPGFRLDEVRAINNAGVIVGLGTTNGLQHGVVLIPVSSTPDPHEPSFDFSGFLRPVANTPAVNAATAGRAIPVRFTLGGNHGLHVLAGGSPQSESVACDTSAPTGSIEEAQSPGGSSLSYDPLTDIYTYVWKTDKRWANTCRELIVRLTDNSEHRARFRFVR